MNVVAGSKQPIWIRYEVPATELKLRRDCSPQLSSLLATSAPGVGQAAPE